MRFRALLLTSLALFLIGVLPAVGAQQPATPAAGKNRVVMQVSDNDPAKWSLALNNARNLQADLGRDNVEIELVAYGPGIGMLKRESAVGSRIAEAMNPTGIFAALRTFDALAEARGTVRGDEAPVRFFANGARLRSAHGHHFG